jgi:hypothetical protein
LELWLDRVAVRGEVVVQFWLKPVKTTAAMEPREEERMLAQLRKVFVNNVWLFLRFSLLKPRAESWMGSQLFEGLRLVR